MTVAFPAIQPTAHEFTGPDWPITETRAQSGVRSVRLWGDKASDAEMTLTFANKTQVEARQIWAAHKAARGKIDDITFPSIVFNGVTDADLLDFLQNAGPGLQWYWLAAPSGVRVTGGRVTLTCEFRAELRL